MFQPASEQELHTGAGRGGQFTGAHLISKEELETASQTDENLCKIREYIEQDRAYVVELKKELTILAKQQRGIKLRISLMRARIRNRQHQHQHFKKLLRKTMAFDKIKQLRKEAGL